jgi:hypothetical protein
MCEKCPVGTGYAQAYRYAESVTVRVKTYCPRCSEPVSTGDGQIHFGCEFWEPCLSCKCGWVLIVSVHVKGPNKLNS